MFSDRIILKSVSYTTNEEGRPEKKSIEREVWANKKSVTRAEFYASNQVGINITAVFEVNPEDYQSETEITADKDYTIVRAYQKGQGKIELICKDKIK